MIRTFLKMAAVNLAPILIQLGIQKYAQSKQTQQQQPQQPQIDAGQHVQHVYQSETRKPTKPKPSKKVLDQAKKARHEQKKQHEIKQRYKITTEVKHKDGTRLHFRCHPHDMAHEELKHVACMFCIMVEDEADAKITWNQAMSLFLELRGRCMDPKHEHYVGPKGAHRDGFIHYGIKLAYILRDRFHGGEEWYAKRYGTKNLEEASREAACNKKWFQPSDFKF